MAALSMIRGLTLTLGSWIPLINSLYEILLNHLKADWLDGKALMGWWGFAGVSIGKKKFKLKFILINTEWYECI